MSVSQVGTPSAPTRITATGNLTPTYSGTQPRTAGDVLLAYVSVAAVTSVSTLPTPSGWTKLPEITNGANTSAWYWTIATGGDTAPTFTSVTFSGTGAAVASLFELTGNDGTTPVVTSGTGSGAAAAETATTSGNVPSAGCYGLVGFSQFTSAAATRTWTVGSGWTNFLSDFTTSSRAHQLVEIQSNPTSGATLTGNGTFSTTPTSYGAYVIVVQPPAASPVTVALPSLDTPVAAPTLTPSASVALPVVNVATVAPALTPTLTTPLGVLNVAVVAQLVTPGVSGGNITVALPALDTPVAALTLAPKVAVTLPALNVAVAALTITPKVTTILGVLNVAVAAPVISVKGSIILPVLNVAVAAPALAPKVSPALGALNVAVAALTITPHTTVPFGTLTVSVQAPALTPKIFTGLPAVGVTILAPPISLQGPPHFPLQLGGTATDLIINGSAVVLLVNGTSAVHEIDGTESTLAYNGTALVVDPQHNGTAAIVAINGTVTETSYNATEVAWGMIAANLTLGEFDDSSVNLAFTTTGGGALDISTATVDVYLKTAAGVSDTDASTKHYSSTGGSPAVTITNGPGGLATVQIPAADIVNATLAFWKASVTIGGKRNTAMFGTVTTTLL